MEMVYHHLRLANGLALEFEFDGAKSRANAEKHGIDFFAATELWLDQDLAEVPARESSEPRYTVIGRIGEKHWTAVVTDRGRRIRITSVRRSRPREVSLYEGQ